MTWGNWDSIWRHPAHAKTHAIRRDPLSIGISFLVNIGYAGAISGIGATLVGSAIIGAALLGISLLTSALQPKPGRPKAQDQQATVRQSVGPRMRYYGRVKVGGTLWFFESNNGSLFCAITLNEGEISSITEIWLNDQIVTLGEENFVVDAPYVYENDGVTYKRAQLYFKLGTDDQTVHSRLAAAFPGVVTSDHRLRGVANCLAVFAEVPAEKISEVYPQGNPGVRVVMDASLVKSVRTGSRIFSDNPADCIYDYLTGIDGAGFPYGAGLLESQVDIESFRDFADLADEQVPAKGGGYINRYRLNGGYALNEEMRAVLERMCKSCDADLYINGAGKMAIRGGRWVEPTLTLDSSLGHIISGEFRQGQSALAAFNELNITYVDPAQDYMDTEGERWLDSSNIALRGKVLSSQLDMPMVSSHARARRLAKIHTAKSNPHWVGTIVTNFYGLNALGEDTVTVKFSPLGIDETFLVQSVRILDDLTGVQMDVTSLSSAAYVWDADAEEGTGPGSPPDTTQPIALEPPEDFNVSAADLIIDGASVGTYLAATWTEPERTSLSQEIEYRPVGDPTWRFMSTLDGQGFGQSVVVTNDAPYEVRPRTRSPGGVYSEYGPTVTLTATADTSTPSSVTGLVVTPDEGVASLEATHSASSNSVGVRIYRHTTNSYGASTLVRTTYGSPATAIAYSDIIAAGTYYYWLVAFSGSGDDATPTASGAVIVT